MISHKQKLEIEAAFLIIVAVIIGLIAVSIKNGSFQSPFNIISGTSTVQVPVEVVAPKISISSQISPDGTRKVIMKTTQNSENTIYDFSTADENNANEKFIFTKTLNSSENMIIPFNTWSPDNKYFFIAENTKDDKNAFVFKADGTQFTGGETYLDVVDSFEKADTGNDFDEATGWASETLIILNTTKQDNKKGPSYWFEVPSEAIIQLSTEF